MTEINLTRIQRVILAYTGDVKIGKIKKEGWRKSKTLYAFRCKKHGLVSATTSGYKKRLDCPVCIEDLKLDRLWI